jgi:hypothetical protein
MSSELDKVRSAISQLEHVIEGAPKLRPLRHAVMLVGEGLVRSVEALERSQADLDKRLREIE